MSNKRVNGILATAASLAVASLAVGTTSHALTPNQVKPDEALSVLESAPSINDDASSLEDVLGDLPIDVETLRFVGADGTAQYWAGKDDLGNICLIGSISTADSVSASTCTSVVDFYKYGVGLSATDGAKQVTFESYLLPDDVNADDLDLPANPLQATTSRSASAGDTNIVPVDPKSLDGREPVTITRENGHDFTFVPLVPMPEDAS